MIKDPVARELDRVPQGYCGLGRCLNGTRKAYLFEYYGEELWIPKSKLVKAEGGYWAPPWTIKSAKKLNAEYWRQRTVNYDK